MNARIKRLLGLGLALVLAVSLAGIVGCSSDSAEDTSGDEVSTEVPADDSTVDEAVVEDDSGSSDDSEVSEDELRDGAEAIARAWFVGPGSDFTADQFDWNVESLVRDNEGTWWARVSASPKDESMETEQIYVNLMSGMTIWGYVDSGTGIDPATDEQFPEEIRGEL